VAIVHGNPSPTKILAALALDARLTEASACGALFAADLLKDKSGIERPTATKIKAWIPERKLKRHPMVIVISIMRKDTSPIDAKAKMKAAQPPMYSRGGIVAKRSFQGTDTKSTNFSILVSP
jgi:hypothetical protein